MATYFVDDSIAEYAQMYKYAVDRNHEEYGKWQDRIVARYKRQCEYDRQAVLEYKRQVYERENS